MPLPVITENDKGCIVGCIVLGVSTIGTILFVSAIAYATLKLFGII